MLWLGRIPIDLEEVADEHAEGIMTLLNDLELTFCQKEVMERKLMDTQLPQ